MPHAHRHTHRRGEHAQPGVLKNLADFVHYLPFLIAEAVTIERTHLRKDIMSNGARIHASHAAFVPQLILEFFNCFLSRSGYRLIGVYHDGPQA